MKYYLFIFSFIIILTNGQSIITPNFSIKTSPYEVTNYGISSYNIYYRVNFLDNALSSTSNKEVMCILELGDNNISKFLDYNQIKIDSLDERFSGQDRIGSEEMADYLKVRVLWNNVVFKNNNLLIVQDRFKSVYQYEENQPKLNWNLESGEKILLGSKCNNATVHYRGRDYIAWYTTDIPINNGPYIFGGLPGLILEIEDVDKKYTFEAVGITKTPKPIYLRKEKNILKTTREKFRNVQRAYKENPSAFYSGKAYNEDGTPIVLKQQNIKYEPMEIE
ncbi:GLPGLI family protein [Chryseobacterium ureilyticum]|uniref:GLPGLI family protein n=1 Tax=Chryseobacterium ureilyticum TaxID=373668 RepID=A0A1N7N2M7_9FLAO|nr:GLPGLI family protein [Chryseobacterium ureilyticum]SIS92585.1 GLPGLI family protein [Chryseobacterium ureilyticum]